MKLRTLALRLLTALSTVSAITTTAQASGYTVTIVIYENLFWDSLGFDTVNGIKLGGTEQAGIQLAHDYHITDYTPDERDPLTGSLIQRRPTWNATTHFISGGSVEFNSASGAKLSFTDGYSTPFKSQHNLSFNNLGRLKFDSLTETSSRMEYGGAIALANDGNLTISNVRDNNSETADVVFSNIQIKAGASDSKTEASAIGVVHYSNDPIYVNIIDISSNGDVSFLNNTGEATIYPGMRGKVSITGNEDVLFQGNTNTYGCAIDSDSIKINDNQTVNFINNTGYYSLYASSESGGLEIKGNGAVNFIENTSTATSGYAVRSSGDTNFQNNGDITFKGNIGGGITGTYCSIDSNGNIRFENNTYNAMRCGETHITNNKNVTFSGNEGHGLMSTEYIEISGNEDISFSNHTESAIWASVGVSIISNNHDVIFENNTTDNGSGAAICGSPFAITNNNDVTFKGNHVYGEDTSRGGAIYCSKLQIEGNQDINFIDNSASHGGAISGTSTFTQNGNITFSDNKARTYYGGAISGTPTFTQNGDITFSGNSAKLHGGALYGGNTITFEGNGNIIFSENSAESGGAISAPTTFTNNGNISFFNNTATGEKGGAAISATTINMTGNANIVVQGNISNSATACHGALHFTSYGPYTISDNKSVSFIGNKVISETASNVYAGAISANTHALPKVQICNNGRVEFKGNGAVSQNESAGIYAGAICIIDDSYNGKALTIAGNESVTFEKNYRYWNVDGADTLNLRGLYVGSHNSLNLSAKTGGHITFNDRLYSAGTVKLNADYVDADGVTQKATGDIILSGKYTEQHLNDILSSEGANRTATEREITLSRTSTLYKGATLYGGSLQIKDSAILNANSNLTVEADSNAKIVVSNNAELNTTNSLVLKENSHATLQVQGGVVTAGTSSSYGIDIKNTGALDLSDGAVITAYDINIEDGATLRLSEAATGGLSTYSTEGIEGSEIFNQSTAAEVSAILNIAGGATLIADGGNLDMTGHAVTLAVTQGTEKINLQLTRGAGYEEDSLVLLLTNTGNVKFSFDNVTGKTSGEALTLNASDYFSGDWINEDTKLIYDNGNIYLQGVNNVAVPEPTTTTLSLLALAALAARRRRSK